MKPKHQRLILIVVALVSLATGLTLVLRHFNDQLIFFYDPTQLQTVSLAPNQVIRVGGLVKEGSVISHMQDNKNQRVEFVLTDGAHYVIVQYRGILPDLFREGQGMVAQGSFDAQGVFNAQQLLAKHDETYMPPEVANALKKSGHWKADSE